MDALNKAAEFVLGCIVALVRNAPNIWRSANTDTYIVVECEVIEITITDVVADIYSA